MILSETHTRLTGPFRVVIRPITSRLSGTHRASSTHEPPRLLAASRAPGDSPLRVNYQSKKKPAQVPAFENVGEKLIAWKIEGDVAPSAGLLSYVRLLLRLA